MAGHEKFALSITSNDTFREIFQGSAEGIIMVNEAGTIMLANPVSEEMFGYSNGELIGQPLESLLPPRYRGGHDHLRKNFNAHPSPRRMGVGRDLMAIKKSGQEFPVEVSLSYKKNGDEL